MAEPVTSPHSPAESEVLLSAALMTHPLRLTQARELAALLASVRVVIDPEPTAAPNPLRTAAVAWGTAGAGYTHHAVLQDDIEAGADLLDVMAVGCRRHPDAAVAYYAHWDTRNGALVRLAALAGAAWVRARREEFTPTLALCLPADVAVGFPDYASGAQVINDDEIMSEYLRQSGRTTYVSVPNLVEHIGDDSISGHDDHGIRRSACYVSAGDVIDVLAGGETVEEVAFVPYLCRGRSHVIVDGAVTGSGTSCIDWRDTLRFLPLGEQDVVSGTSRGEFAGEPPWSALAAEFGPDYAWELWSHGFLVGWQAERISRGLNSALPARHPELAALTRHRAIATVGVAGLPMSKRGQVSEAGHELLVTCAEQRIEAGHQFAALSI
jgi:hypothetical protein